MREPRPGVGLFFFNAVTYLVAGLVVVSWLPAMLLLLAATRPFDPDRRLVGRFLRWGAALVARSFSPWQVRIEGRWPAGHRACVVVANHASHVDILLLSHLPREMKWMAKIDGFRLPLLGWLFRLAGDLPVHPGDAGANLRTLNRAKAYLRRGTSVMVFPEGRLNRGELLPFKPGAFRLAAQCGVPVLPVAVTGTDRALPWDGRLLRPAALTARLLEPIVPPPDMDPAALRDLVRARIAGALEAATEAQGAAGSTITSNA